jgi:hypothetical protein
MINWIKSLFGMNKKVEEVPQKVEVEETPKPKKKRAPRKSTTKKTTTKKTTTKKKAPKKETSWKETK